MFEASIDPSAAPAPDHGVQLVDEQDDVAAGLLDFLQHRLQPVLELAAVLRPRDERPEVEADQLLVLQRLRHVAGDDALGEALHDRGLADAGLADEHGVVLGAAGEDLDHAADLVVAADDRIQLPLAGQLGEVAPVLLEGLVAVLRVGIVDALVPADLAQHGQHAVAGDPVPLQDLARHRLGLDEREEEVLGGHVLVLQRLRLPQRALQHAVQLGRDLRGRALGARQRAQRAIEVLEDGAGRHAHLAEGRGHDAALLVDQRPQEVLGRHLRVVAFLGLGLRGGDRLLRLDGELIHAHGAASNSEYSPPPRKLSSANIGPPWRLARRPRWSPLNAR